MTTHLIPNLPGEWRFQGPCGEDPELFHPKEGAAEQTAEAKAACAACPVIAECRAHVLALPYAEVGVWGGMTEMERRMERAKRRRA